jgi:hypothetical protein
VLCVFVPANLALFSLLSERVVQVLRCAGCS